ncbi:HyaD/HybD family hydrogenase maturation endopeptidase [Sedimenticola selenatireducens]|uniref:Hydrogenase maturation protease n=1 Tax=Sedimenticola selenatireducens TaxID=191960 RepID=A0A557RZ74_9GAMM|nr:HyaD/HybD family hydrogenase maturation endopeptidase [Sedimenticola selenatireducens]TVO70438.1 hydrogenase maturation protease [Sedimenticola selenatireducens]TVT63015.1 MAG: hydrogenase maturation protease [Sedimenticola selenatireducens]
MPIDSKRTLVLGIGNTIMTDEGVGIHVIEHLQKIYPEKEDVSFVDGGTLSFSLAGFLAEHEQLIVVDAARTGGAPGSVVCYEGNEMDRYLTGNRQSVHEVGLTDLLDIARLSDHYPENRALIGIEPESMDWGDEPTASVAPAIPQAADIVIKLIDRWGMQK